MRLLGKAPKKDDARNLPFGRYTARLPQVQPRLWAWKYDELANPHRPPADVITFDDFANKSRPVCTCSAIGHLDQVVAEHTQTAEAVTTPIVIEAHKAIAWNAESGAAMLDALKWFRKRGLIGAFVELELRNRFHLRLAVSLLGGAYIGADLPLAAQTQTLWDVSATGSKDPAFKRGSWGGHAMLVVGWDRSGVWVVTWGRLQRVTWEWIDTYVDEAYGVIHKRWTTGELAPSGYLSTAIAADLALIGDIR